MSSFGKFLGALFAAFCLETALAQSAEPSRNVIAFYYGWYGNPKTDGEYRNWNHGVADESGKRFPGGDDIGANFYPEAGTYSSADLETLDRQMLELRRARVGVISASWWGKDHLTDRNMKRLLDGAHTHGIFVNFHIEPFGGRNGRTTKEALRYVIDTYGEHPAMHRLATHGERSRPVFFVYDSYLTAAEDWAEVLTAGKAESIRGTKYDAVMIGLWVKEKDGNAIKRAGFDGFYSYFGSDGFTWGSSSKNWGEMGKFAAANSLLFIPSVGPGYIDTRIRPWNNSTTRERANGRYYEKMFKAAMAVKPEIISITSYNEWHEGTQIEPAVPKKIEGFTYLDYSPLSPSAYLDITAELVGRFERATGRRKN